MNKSYSLTQLKPVVLGHIECVLDEPDSYTELVPFYCRERYLLQLDYDIILIA